jgi:hypothetical protein
MNVCDAETCPNPKPPLLRAGRVFFGGLLRESRRFGYLPEGARARARGWEPGAHGP